MSITKLPYVDRFDIIAHATIPYIQKNTEVAIRNYVIEYINLFNYKPQNIEACAQNIINTKIKPIMSKLNYQFAKSGKDNVLDNQGNVKIPNQYQLAHDTYRGLKILYNKAYNLYVNQQKSYDNFFKTTMNKVNSYVPNIIKLKDNDIDNIISTYNMNNNVQKPVNSGLKNTLNNKKNP